MASSGPCLKVWAEWHRWQHEAGRCGRQPVWRMDANISRKISSFPEPRPLLPHIIYASGSISKHIHMYVIMTCNALTCNKEEDRILKGARSLWQMVLYNAVVSNSTWWIGIPRRRGWHFLHMYWLPSCRMNEENLTKSEVVTWHFSSRAPNLRRHFDHFISMLFQQVTFLFYGALCHREQFYIDGRPGPLSSFTALLCPPKQTQPQLDSRKCF